MALTDKLSAIGVAIREKTGDAWKYSLDEMPAAIRSIETGGGGSVDLPDTAFIITGDCDYHFKGWGWFIEEFGNKITSQDITTAQYMFYSGCENITTIPFELNFAYPDYAPNCSNLFSGMPNLTYIAPMNNLSPGRMDYMFANCTSLMALPEMNNFDSQYINNDGYCDLKCMFHSCSALRSIPEEFLKKIYNPTSYSWSSHLEAMFFGCGALDEIRGLRVSPASYIGDNMFSETFNYCFRAKEIIFATQDDGTPYAYDASNQHIDLTQGVGYIFDSGYGWMMNNASGTLFNYDGSDIKQQSNAFTYDINYSRYNKESAINTINSLPDASSGSGNIISFMRAAGASTDEGAIGDMTDAEIAVAAAKGWTVSFVD